MITPAFMLPVPISCWSTYDCQDRSSENKEWLEYTYLHYDVTKYEKRPVETTEVSILFVGQRFDKTRFLFRKYSHLRVRCERGTKDHPHPLAVNY